MIRIRSEKCFLGDAMRISNGIIEILVTLSVGPRILSLRKVDGEDIMFNDLEDKVNRDCSAIYGEGAKWHIYGGHRLWLSPEDETTYYPDNTKVKSTVLNNGVLLTPKEWKVVKIQPSIKIEFVGDNSLRITHKIINKGEKRKLCIWALTVMKAGGTLTVNLPTRKTGLLPNSNMAFWSYNDLTTGDFKLEQGRIVLKSRKDAATPFKVGLFNEKIKSVYKLGDNVFIKETESDLDGEYPDFHCNFESYTSNLIHEVETLSPIREVEEGKEMEHVELWTLK